MQACYCGLPSAPHTPATCQRWPMKGSGGVAAEAALAKGTDGGSEKGSGGSEKGSGGSEKGSEAELIHCDKNVKKALRKR